MVTKWVRREDIPATRTVYAVAGDDRRVGQGRQMHGGLPRAAYAVTCGP